MGFLDTKFVRACRDKNAQYIVFNRLQRKQLQ